MAISSAQRYVKTPQDKRFDLSVPSLPIVQLSVNQYESMIREGILKHPERFELLNGWIVRKMTHNPRDDSAVFRLQRRLSKLLGDEWLVRVQSAISIIKSLPEPDVVVVPGPEDRYDRVRPTPKEIELIVEVSDSSLGQDRGIKKELYAKSRIAVYWIVNLVDRQIEVHTLPRAGKSPSFRKREVLVPGDAVPVVFGGQCHGELAIDELLP